MAKSGKSMASVSESLSAAKAVKESSIAATTRVTNISYSDLVAGKDLSGEIERAFGYDGLGIVAVTGVPGMAEKRETLLAMGFAFAHLPKDIQAKYEHPSSFWSFGWSHGKEKLQGRPDTSKGSYYNNPTTNTPFSYLGEDERKAIVEEYPSFAHPNIWPSEGDLPGMEETFMSLGGLVVETGIKLAAAVDAYVKTQTGDTGCRGCNLAKVIEGSQVIKARLLHYFAKEEGEQEAVNADDAFSSWCGWHNDHGSLTGLVPALYYDEAKVAEATTKGTKPIDAAKQGAVPNPDPEAGLYIRSRKGKLVRATIGKDTAAHSTLLFQIGETAQVMSGGILQATPHAVRGSSVAGVSRTTFAVFMEPNMDEKMLGPSDRKPEESQTSEAVKHLPKACPPLGKRYGTKRCPFTTCNFGEFTKATLDELH